MKLQAIRAIRTFVFKGNIRYERGSIILTSNYNFEDWGKVFQDDVVAAAIIDRLVHHAKIFYINGTSYRLKNKLKKPS